MQEIPSLSDFPILEQVDPKSKLRKAPWYDLNRSRSFDFIIDEYYFENFYSKLVKLFEANSIPLIRKLQNTNVPYYSIKIRNQKVHIYNNQYMLFEIQNNQIYLKKKSIAGVMQCFQWHVQLGLELSEEFQMEVEHLDKLENNVKNQRAALTEILYSRFCFKIMYQILKAQLLTFLCSKFIENNDSFNQACQKSMELCQIAEEEWKNVEKFGINQHKVTLKMSIIMWSFSKIWIFQRNKNYRMHFFIVMKILELYTQLGMIVHSTIELIYDLDVKQILEPSKYVEILIPLTKQTTFPASLFLFYLTTEIKLPIFLDFLQYFKSFQLKQFDAGQKGCQEIDKYDFQQIQAIQISHTGASGVIFIQNDSESLVLKGTIEPALDTYLYHICNQLGVLVPRMKIIRWDAPLYQEINKKIKQISMNDEVIHRRVESRMDVQYLMISEYIPGFSLVRRKLDEILRIFDMKQEDTQERLESLGKIIGFDILINNCDRFPLLWNNIGNLDNFQLKANGDGFGNFYAIDHISVKLGAQNEKYLQNLQNWIKLLKSEKESNFENSSIIVHFKTVIKNYTTVEICSESCIIIIESIYKTLLQIKELKLEELQKGLRIAENEDWEKVWNKNLESIGIDLYLEVQKTLTLLD